ncbi:MAG: NUDIX domain-containing protein [Rikenellaceae bacterium]
MTVETNHTLSVDCVIFGYDDDGLKVLLVKQRPAPNQNDIPQLMKLPGSMILENETLPEAANRVLAESTGLEQVYLQQTKIFSDPNRVTSSEIEWIADYHNITTHRVVTVAYYALVRITPKILRHTAIKQARWQLCSQIEALALDHIDIFTDALERLRNDFQHSPIAFELVSKRFTIRELQSLYAAVMGVEIDSRNFRKKLLTTNIIRATGVRESGVAHKPAEYYTFDAAAFRKASKSKFRLTYI